MRWCDRDRERLSGPEGGISIDLEVLCGCVEVLTYSVALLFSVLSVTQQFVGVFLRDTSGTIPPGGRSSPFLWSCFL